MALQTEVKAIPPSSEKHLSETRSVLWMKENHSLLNARIPKLLCSSAINAHRRHLASVGLHTAMTSL